MDYNLECVDCRETPTVKEWREYNKNVGLLGIENLPEEGFQNVEEFYKFQHESGTQLDCPACGELNSIEDIEIY